MGQFDRDWEIPVSRLGSPQCEVWGGLLFNCSGERVAYSPLERSARESITAPITKAGSGSPLTTRRLVPADDAEFFLTDLASRLEGRVQPGAQVFRRPVGRKRLEGKNVCFLLKDCYYPFSMQMQCIYHREGDLDGF